MLFEDRLRYCSCKSDPMVVGIVPEREFPLRSSDSSAVIAPIAVGNVPERRFPARFSNLSSGSMHPVILARRPQCATRCKLTYVTAVRSDRLSLRVPVKLLLDSDRRLQNTSTR